MRMMKLESPYKFLFPRPKSFAKVMQFVFQEVYAIERQLHIHRQRELTNGLVSR